jgi:hypothetical protein
MKINSYKCFDWNIINNNITLGDQESAVSIIDLDKNSIIKKYNLNKGPI